MLQIFIALFLCSPFLYAIPIVDIKGVTTHFKDPHYSPVVGMAALNSGLIYNYRFFGCKPAYHADGSRDYTNDKPLDSVTSFLKVLFPSTGGALASVTTGNSNFGRKASVKKVAQMLHFSRDVRTLLDTPKYWNASTLNIEGRRMSAWLWEEYKALGFLREKIYYSETEEYFGEGLYPKFTTEQMILAFFVHKFSRKREILELMQYLGPDFIKGGEANPLLSATPNEAQTNFCMDSWSLGDRARAEGLEEDLDFASIGGSSYFYEVVPYSNNASPIGPSACPQVEVMRDGSKRLCSTRTMADCAETLIRHIMNMLFFDMTEKSFKIPESIQNPQLHLFYEQQKPKDSNSGSAEMRGQWALLTHGIKDVRYNPSGDIQAGWLNVIRVIRHILGEEPSELPHHTNKAFESEIKSLVKRMSPDSEAKKVSINLTQEDIRQDYSCPLECVITNKEGLDFSFVALPSYMQNVKFAAPEGGALQLIFSFTDPVLSLINQQQERHNLYRLFGRIEMNTEVSKYAIIESFIKSDEYTKNTKKYNKFVLNLIKSYSAYSKPLESPQFMFFLTKLTAVGLCLDKAEEVIKNVEKLNIYNIDPVVVMATHLAQRWLCTCEAAEIYDKAKEALEFFIHPGDSLTRNNINLLGQTVDNSLGRKNDLYRSLDEWAKSDPNNYAVVMEKLVEELGGSLSLEDGTPALASIIRSWRFACTQKKASEEDFKRFCDFFDCDAEAAKQEDTFVEKVRVKLQETENEESFKGLENLLNQFIMQKGGEGQALYDPRSTFLKNKTQRLGEQFEELTKKDYRKPLRALMKQRGIKESADEMEHFLHQICPQMIEQGG